MTYKCNVLFVPGHRAPVVRGNHVGRLSSLFFAACARIQPRAYMHARWQTPHAVSRAPRHRRRVCVPALLCVTRIIRALAPGRGRARRLLPSRAADLDKSKITVAEVRPRVPHLISPFRSISESRTALNLVAAAYSSSRRRTIHSLRRTGRMSRLAAEKGV